MESALAQVRDQAAVHRASRVNRIVLRIGALAGVDPEALRFAFEVVSRSTVAEGATLVIEPVAARAYCPECSREFDVETGFIFTCPVCNGLCGEIRCGRELELSRLEMS